MRKFGEGGLGVVFFHVRESSTTEKSRSRGDYLILSRAYCDSSDSFDSGGAPHQMLNVLCGNPLPSQTIPRSSPSPLEGK